MIPIKPARQKAFVKLLDDEDHGIRRGLLDAFREHGDSATEFLTGIVEKDRNGLGKHARFFLRELGAINTVSDFREFIESLNYELETGFLMLERTIYANREVEDYQLLLDEMAGRVKELLVEGTSRIETCKVINRVLFHDFEFRGEKEDFYNPENSMLGTVLERRRGIPLTLSVIYLLVADRCGFQLEPVGFPVRFMLGCFEEEVPFFIDPFAGGTILSRGDIEAFLWENSVTPMDAFFQPTPVGEILCRSCRNLVHQYQLAGDSELSDRFASFVDEFERVYREHSTLE
jgi:regulator of sirC expression with transglutaminase-like and TPR domain